MTDRPEDLLLHNSQIPGGSVFRRYGLALTLVSAALWLSVSLQTAFSGPFWVLFPMAVIVSNWYGGRGSGWFAATLSALAVQYYFIPPVKEWGFRPRDIPFFFCFVGVQVLANWIVSWRRRTESSIRRSSKELVERVREQQRTEETLQQTRAELARVSRVIMVGELAASIAHEVNQPLAAVVANSDACLAWLMASPPNLDEAREAAKQAGDGAIHASEVIKRIRSLINNAPSERSPVQVNDLLKMTIALTEGQAASAGVAIVADLAPELPDIRADRIQLQQVMINLMTNGITAMSGLTSKPLRLEVQSLLNGSNEICISVSDKGVGVAPELLPKLFDPFYTTRTQGLGMGLTISRSIIESHGGRLSVESKLGVGSQFRLTLPRHQGDVG